ncbi:MAG: hypothetical protein ACREVW_02265 [Burkholderiales bacterium]
MLALSAHNQFHGSITNYGATMTDAGFGTTVPAHANAHTKGAAGALIAGASVSSDVYGIAVLACGGNSNAAVHRFLLDLLVDPAGGTSWSTLIANILFHSPSFQKGLYQYFFPLWLKAGSSIGAQQQSSTAAQGIQIGVRLLTKPSRPELIKVGYTAESYGAVTASTSGTAITVGNGVAGAWTSVGTTAGRPWWWQAGLASDDTSMTMAGALLDVSVGDAANKRLAAEGILYSNDSTERVGKAAVGEYQPVMQAVPAETVYMRGTAPGAPDTSTTVCAYGVI